LTINIIKINFAYLGFSDIVMQNNYFNSFIMVCIAGMFWSLGAPIVRFIEDSENYRLAYLLYRGLSVSIVIMIFILFRERSNFLNSIKRIDSWSMLGGLLLAIAMFGFIYSITVTTVAVTMIMLALSPLISSILGYLILDESISKTTIINMFIVIAGILVMLTGTDETGTLIGAAYGFIVACCYSMYTITIRHDPEIPKLLTPAIGGILCASIALLIIVLTDSSVLMPIINISLSVINGMVVAVGLILFSFGAKYLPTGELVLLSLIEVIGGIFWVWLPFIGINETPSLSTLAGGSIILIAIINQGLFTKKNHAMLAP